MADNDLIRRCDALNAVRLGDTFTKIQARIAALPAVTDLDKAQRTIAARDRRIDRLVSALNDARAKGYKTQAEQDCAIVQSDEITAPEDQFGTDATDATARKGEQRTICEDCGNANLAHDRAVWTDDGTSYCPTCRAALEEGRT